MISVSITHFRWLLCFFQRHYYHVWIFQEKFICHSFMDLSTSAKLDGTTRTVTRQVVVREDVNLKDAQQRPVRIEEVITRVYEKPVVEERVR